MFDARTRSTLAGSAGTALIRSRKGTRMSRDPSTVGIVVPLWMLAMIAVGFFLRESRELCVPIALAVLFSYALYPAVSWLTRHRVPRLAAATLVVGGLLGVTLLGVSTLGDDVRSAAETLPQQLREVQQRLRSGSGGLMQRVRESAREAQKVGQVATTGGPQSGKAPADQGGGASGPMADYLWQGSAGLVSLAGHVTVITFLVFFILLSAPAWRRRLIVLSGDVLSSRRTGTEVLDEISWQVQRFLLVRLVTSVVVGVATWLALAWLGAPAAPVWGLAAGAVNSIPFFGPLIVSAGLFLVGLVSSGVGDAVTYALVALAITAAEGWLLTPPLMGRAARMNTLAVFLGLLVWSWAWGIWGTLLAVPMMTVIKAVCDHVERLNPLAKLLEE
ncbi:MAG TPA: AI-2E family transporter [Vicinamibacterales bacterium]